MLALRHHIWAFLLPLIPAVALVLFVCGLIYLREADHDMSNVLEREGKRVDIYGDLFRDDIASIIEDLRMLASGDGMDSYLDSNNPADINRAVERAVFVSRNNPAYDAIRYIDETGHEVFRVNRGGVVVPRDELQDKSDRPFFQKAIVLAPGEIFISAIDLDVDHGAIAQPIKPTIRMAVPLFDAYQRHRGIYVINYLMSASVTRLRQFIPQYASRLRLLNDDGYWLVGASSGDEWGFLLPERADRNLMRTDPALWGRMLSQPNGQEPFHGGYISWSRVDPSRFLPEKQIRLVAERKFIIFASVVTPQEWSAYLVGLRENFVIVAFLLTVLTTGVAWFFQLRRHAQGELDRFFRLTRDMMCIAGFDGRFKRINLAWEKTLGYSMAEMIDEPFLKFIHPADRDRTVAETNRLRHGGETIAFENRYRCKDGSYRWLLWSARSLPGERLIYATARDTTEKRRIEEQLRQSEERSRLMIESMQDYALLMLAPDGRVASWNAGAERIYGYRAEAIIGQHFSRFYPEEKIAANYPQRELQLAQETGRHEDEGLRLRPDGTTFWASVVLWPMRSADGELLGFVKITRDVTARREAAARIENLNAELKTRADLLESANRELESFSYSVSHDLRAPLRHIHGFIELLQKSPAFVTEETAQRHMAIIARAARDMGGLIDDLLAFSRTSRLEMRLAPVDMNALVTECIRSVEIETKERRIIWDVQPLSPVEGDTGLLRQVWANLIDNAVKYTRPRAEARIEIGQRDGDPTAKCEQREFVYFVRDNGVGFDMRYAGKLFGVFQRLHRAEDFEGSGIGLANVQRILQRHGGRVWVEAQPDQGATFFFSLPIPSNPPLEAHANGKV
jgi:PAS domain S-box-containing protein